MQYIRQLDAIRAIAVFLVIIHHWAPPNSVFHVWPTGPLGVDIFFVLSGFLITGILLRQKQGGATASVVKSFYWRRALRIFPIYYLTILLLLIFQPYINSNIPGSFPYLFTYTSNFYFFDRGEWDGAISHLWSLAVEEQFYLLWPWVVLLIPQRWLWQAIAAFVLVGAGTQYAMQDVALHSILPFACLDAFGLGALLAWFLQYKPQQMPRFYNATVIGAAVGAVCAVGHLYLSAFLLPLRTAHALMALWLITYVVTRGEQVQGKFLLNNGALIFLGKISYGLYLYHLIVSQVLQPQLVQPYLHPLLPEFITTHYLGLLSLAENALVLLLLAVLSYFLFETRFLKLKRHFGYADPGHRQKTEGLRPTKMPATAKALPNRSK